MVIERDQKVYTFNEKNQLDAEDVFSKHMDDLPRELNRVLYCAGNSYLRFCPKIHENKVGSLLCAMIIFYRTFVRYTAISMASVNTQ